MAGGVSPLAICHAISPLFMSYAVMRPYGGFINGRPSILGRPRPSPLIYIAVWAFGWGRVKAMTAGAVTEPTYTNPVSGSAAPDSQSAPPPKPGTAIVPRVPPGAFPSEPGV